jgi:hypothetical protein
MQLSDLLALASAKNYLAIVLLLALYARKLVGPDSKFPISLSPNWRPTVTAAIGLVYVFVVALQGGKSLPMAGLDAFAVAATTGFADGLLTAIFNHAAAPSWARALVFIFDELGGGSAPGAGGGAGLAAVAASTYAIGWRLFAIMFGGTGLILALAFVASLAGCTQQQVKQAQSIAIKLTDDACQLEAQDPNEPAFVAVACIVEGSLVHVLVPTGSLATVLPKAAAQLKAQAGK